MKRQMISLSIIVVLFMCLSDVIIADDQKFLDTTDRQTMMYQPMQDEYDCGDANIDGTVNVVDIVYLWNYLFKGGPLPYYAGRGDIDGIKGISNNDAVRLADYLYMGGSLWPACAPFLYDPIPQSLDTIRFTNLTVAPNQDTVTVEVWLSVDPDDTVTGLSIPFTFYCPGSAYIYCDYIDRTGGLFESHNLSLTYIDTANNYAMFAVGGPALGGIDITGPATGLAFTAQFTVEPSPTGRTIDIFSANPYRGKLELSLRDGGLMAARPVVIGIDFEDIYAVNPFPHEAQVGNATSISVTFSEQMDGSSIAESTVVVQGNMTGYHAPVGFQYSGTTHTLVWHLSLGFLTGEMVSVSVAPGLEVQDGTPLDDPRAWMFTVGSGDALGAFGTDTVYSVGSEPHCVYAGDFDNNGYPDFATADHNSNNVSVWLNDGAGGFTGYATYGVGNWPRSIYGGDFNKDGYLDLAVANYTSGNVTILRNDMDGTFTPYGPYSVGANPTSIIVADLSNDGHQDLAVSNSADDNISVLLNNAGGGFDPQSTFPVGNLPYGVGTGDMDLDGDIDLAVANQDGNSITVLLNDGAGSFTTDSVYSVSSELMSICVADLNNDLYPDLAVPSYTASEIGVLFNNGDATFGGPGTHTVGSGANCVIANDLDGDGFLDLMTANTNEDSISVLLNDGYGGFAAAVSYSVGSGPGWVAPFDYDFDGDLDLVVSNRLAGTVSILRNQNTGITVTNLTDAGDGSLRWAIEQANTNPGSDTITFAVSGVIEPLTALPSLTDDSTTILGSSAPGGAGGVIISGTNVPGSIGLTISSSRNRIEGLIIDGFNDGIGVNGTARGNWIGPDNVIQASEGNGLSFNGAGTDSNSVIGNTIINPIIAIIEGLLPTHSTFYA
ncbi:MAG: FG-GAP-like repeat-containing protein, partial [Candidatus Thorarchaeota archaeon]